MSSNCDVKPEKRYLLIPGKINTGDGVIKWVSARNLLDLYNVPVEECELYIEADAKRNRELYSRLIPLRPLFNGRYEEFLSRYFEVEKRIESALISLGPILLKNSIMVKSAIMKELRDCRDEGLIEFGIDTRQKALEDRRG